MNDEKLLAEFSIAGEPVSKARARFTNYGSKARAYTPAKTLEAERAIASSYVASGGVLHDDSDQAFGVVIEFLHETGQRRDIDNMIKAVFDALNGVAWPDDVQVTFVSASKRRVPKGDAATRVTLFDIGRIEKPRGKCKGCGAEFAQYASTSSRKFCNQDCLNAYRRTARERTCVECGVAFHSQSPAKNPPYCSRACASENKRVDLVCVYCSAAFTKPQSLANKGVQTCSVDCRQSYHRERRKAAAKGTCRDCAGPTSKKGYMRCRACNYAAGGRWAAGKHIRITPLEETP